MKCKHIQIYDDITQHVHTFNAEDFNFVDYLNQVFGIDYTNIDEYDDDEALNFIYVIKLYLKICLYIKNDVKQVFQYEPLGKEIRTFGEDL